MNESLTASRLSDLTCGSERRWWMLATLALAVPYAATLALALTGATIAGLGGPHACPLQTLAEIPCPLHDNAYAGIAVV